MKRINEKFIITEPNMLPDFCIGKNIFLMSVWRKYDMRNHSMRSFLLLPQDKEIPNLFTTYKFIFDCDGYGARNSIYIIKNCFIDGIGDANFSIVTDKRKIYEFSASIITGIYEMEDEMVELFKYIINTKYRNLIITT